MENMINKEFQDFVEFQLIEGGKTKMRLIEFVSILNLIPMKVMKVIYMMKNLMNTNFNTSWNLN
jgi:hypothetical protein